MPTPRNSSLRPGGKSASNWSSKRPSARMSLVQDEFPSATVVAMLPHSNNPGQNPAWIHLRNFDTGDTRNINKLQLSVFAGQRVQA